MKHQILLTVWWPVGGIRTYLRYVYGSEQLAKYEFTILCTVRPDSSVGDLSAIWPGMKVVEVAPSPWRFFWTVMKHVRGGSYHLVHAQGLTSAILSAIPCLVARVPYFVTLHDMFGEGTFKGRWQGLKSSITAWTLSHAVAIQALSNDARENVARRYPKLAAKRGHIVTVNTGIVAHRFRSAEPRDLRRELGLPDDVFLFGFLGRFMSLKGFRYLVLALRDLRLKNPTKREFVVVAVGSGGFIREDTRFVEELGLEPHFRFLPFSNDVGPILKGLDAVVIPSLSETAPLLPMEALVAGVPVIGTSCSGLREVLEGTPALVVPPADHQALAQAMGCLLQGDMRMEFESWAAKAAERFDVAGAAARIAGLYEDVMQAANGRA